MEDCFINQCVQRAGEKYSKNVEPCPVVIKSDIILPLIGPSKMPLRKCPDAIWSPSQSGIGPMAGMPSFDLGLNPTRCFVILALLSDGANFVMCLMM